MLTTSFFWLQAKQKTKIAKRNSHARPSSVPQEQLLSGVEIWVAVGSSHYIYLKKKKKNTCSGVGTTQSLNARWRALVGQTFNKLPFIQELHYFIIIFFFFLSTDRPCPAAGSSRASPPS